MYESHWKLTTRPFECTADTNFYFASEAHQGALLKLRYAVENHRGAALLTGAAGLGKTLLVHALRKQLTDDFSPRVHLVFPEMPADQLLALLADELSGEPTTSIPTLKQSVSRIQQTLRTNHQQGKHALVVVDEAQALRDKNALETLRMLLNFEHDLQPALTLLFVGQPSLLPALDRMPELDSWLSVKCLLRPFSLEETQQYVSHRLQAAGRSEPLFEEKAIEAVHYFSHGVPRQINRLCDLSLLIGYAEERHDIGVKQVEAVAEELVSISPE